MLDHLQGLRSKDWSLIERTHGEAVSNLQARRERGEADQYERPKRHEDVTAMLSARAPTLSAVSNPALLKANRLLKGADPEAVMPRATSPKTNAFFRGLLNPQHADPHLAIDYRMADLAANSMRSYSKPSSPRGIDSAKPGSVGEARYAAHENVVATAGRMLAKRGGSQFAAYSQPLASQAGYWSMAKTYEMEHPEAKKGKGPTRQDQPYMRETGRPAPY